jgi:murein L,D-transpeptidase YcbB/YkuD
MPIWFTNRGVKARKVDDLFKVISSDVTLDGKGYILKRYRYLKGQLQKDNNRDIEEELKLDISLTSLYKSYLSHHIYGDIKWWEFQNYLKRLRQNKISANWITYKPPYNLEELILNYRPSQVIKMTTPNSFGYKTMLKELKRLKEVQSKGGWKKIPNSSQLRFGRGGERVELLRDRLKSSGDYRCPHREKNYGQCLRKAVKRFQKRHGLFPSGKMNSYTRKKMNISVDWKIEKVLLNLDRIKRLPPQPPKKRYIIVNIPNFRLYYMENGREKLSMRVIVGDKKHHTPIFSNKISFIVLNPYWIIPDSIVRKEIIPKILKNPNYLQERGYEVRLSYNTNSTPIDTSKIDWGRVLKSGQTKKYKFMQPPGPKNALGKIKFKFPNQFSVYLHDTSDRKLFKKGRRAFSHGCIRISEPHNLLSTFAKFEPSVNYDRCQRVLKGKSKKQLNLTHHVPVHIVYLTAWVDSKGLLHYCDDIYNYDKRQKRIVR